MNDKARLSDEQFLGVIDATPLVSIDLVIRNAQQEVLLGLRENRPAQGYWFVPGGRVRKDELLDDAFQRLLITELGDVADWPIARSEAQFLGVYQHLYSDNAFGAEQVSTHYVVLGYALQLPEEFTQRISLQDQHAHARWWSESELLASEKVHANSKAYFDSAYCQ